jgi:hypothetical protein
MMKEVRRCSNRGTFRISREVGRHSRTFFVYFYVRHLPIRLAGALANGDWYEARRAFRRLRIYPRFWFVIQTTA